MPTSDRHDTMDVVSNEISWTLGAVSCAILLGASVGVARVSSLEHEELEVVSDWATLEARASQGSARLLEARLSAGHAVDFELCSRDSMDPGVWADQLELRLVRTDVAEVMFAVPVDSRLLEEVSRNPHGACAVFARVDSLTIEASRLAVAVDAQLRNHASEIVSVPIRARVLARRPLGRVDLLVVVSLLGLSVGWVLLIAWLRKSFGAGCIHGPQSASASARDRGWLGAHRRGRSWVACATGHDGRSHRRARSCGHTNRRRLAARARSRSDGAPSCTRNGVLAVAAANGSEPRRGAVRRVWALCACATDTSCVAECRLDADRGVRALAEWNALDCGARGRRAHRRRDVLSWIRVRRDARR